MKGPKPDSPYLDKELKHKGFDVVAESRNDSSSFNQSSYIQEEMSILDPKPKISKQKTTKLEESLRFSVMKMDESPHKQSFKNQVPQ